MIERVRVVGYGRPATEALAEVVGQVKASAGPLAPVTVIVPSNLAGLSARRLLGAGVGGGTGVAGVGFVTPFRLAELLASDLLLDRRPLTNPVLGAAVRQALVREPGPFAAAADHHATEAALAGLYAELSNVDPALLSQIEEEGGAAARAAVRIHRVVASTLAGFHGEPDIAAAAAGRPDLASALAEHGHLVWYLPAPLTAPLARFLRAALTATPSSVLVGLTGDADADARVLATCQRVGVDVPTASGAGPTVVADRIVSVTDADEEVRAVVRAVAELVEQGVRLDRIGVFHPTPDPYVRMLQQQLAAAEIPANGPVRRRLADSVAGRTVLAALTLPSERWRRDRVMALVSGGPLRNGDVWARPPAWETASRDAGIVQGIGDWTRKIERRITSLEQRQADPTTEAWRQSTITRTLADLRDLGSFVDLLAADVHAVEHAVGWTAKAAAASALLHRLLGEEALRTGWPEPERDAFDRVDAALGRLGALDELDPNPSHATFTRALGAELDVARGRHGRFGDGVVYGPLASAAGHDLDAVFVLGCAEGLCPVPRRDDGMFPDAARLLADGQLELRSDRLHDQHRNFLAALAAAPAGHRVLTFPRGDLRGGRRSTPSRWLLDTASALVGEPVYVTDFDGVHHPAVVVVPSHATGIATAPVAGSLVERDLAALRRHTQVGGDVLDHPTADVVARGLVAQRARASSELTEWDGDLTGQPIPTVADRILSPTQLETWASCGFRYLLASVLGVDDRDEPERVLDLSPMDRGSGVHDVLEHFLLDVLEHGVPEPDEPWTDADRAKVRELAQLTFTEYEARGRTGRPVHWRITRDDILLLLDDFLTEDDAFRSQQRVRPSRVELPFGYTADDAVTIPLRDGRTMSFRGRADRVDRRDDGALVVTDYKTGKGDGYKGIDDGDPVRSGTTLQLGLYAEAAHQLLDAPAAEAHYWMVDPRVGYPRYGYAWTPDRRERLVDVVSAIVEGIEGGVFAAQPGEFNNWRGTNENCRFCQFDQLCPRDRGEHAEAKVAAPQLRVRARLQAPEQP